ncbi:uncharacterized protein LOC126765390 [Bactrocera neohumeralis]|uniref:uncharacterized protein LOC126765390 n=1 Tax=Bactrocera neohumeralis TaxID=98809 RepID=UPI002165CFF9|nr:uncharacterized protein LOC126765390 [Bactrocera neohumeralis]
MLIVFACHSFFLWMTVKLTRHTERFNVINILRTTQSKFNSIDLLDLFEPILCFSADRATHTKQIYKTALHVRIKADNLRKVFPIVAKMNSYNWHHHHYCSIACTVV